MKKVAAVAAAVILIAGIFAACNGNETGKVSDTSQDLGAAMTEAATDISDMFDGSMTSESATQSGTVTTE